jgi:LytS/YehU family sensor histidine kinase
MTYPSEQPGRQTYPLSQFPAGARWLRAAFAVTLMTLLMVGLAWYGHRVLPPPPPFRLTDLTVFIRNLFWLGHSLQTTLIPIALLYILSHTRLFQRMVSREMAARDQIDLLGALIVIQLLAIGFEITFTHSELGRPVGVILQTPGYALLIPVVGGLLGGWKMGLVLGVNTWLVRGTYDVLFRIPPFDLYQYDNFIGMIASLSWRDVVLKGYLINLWALTPVWAGVVTGIAGSQLGHHRFSPVALLTLIVALYTGGGALTLVSRGRLTVVEWLPSTLTSGLGLMAVGLMIGNVRSNLAQRQAEAAELALARAELRALRAQINPHFLFNALTTIRYFVRTDPPTARQLLLDLSQILQRALRSEQFVPLRDEMDYVRSYLALEKARFNDRLQIEWTMAADDCLDQPVPVLILQPIVENAVLHGISPKPGGGQIHISIQYENGCLRLLVEDNGTGFDPCKLDEILSSEAAESQDSCIGLRNVDGRLRALYGSQHTLSIQSEVGRGTRVQITIPVDSHGGK